MLYKRTKVATKLPLLCGIHHETISRGLVMRNSSPQMTGCPCERPSENNVHILCVLSPPLKLQVNNVGTRFLMNNWGAWDGKAGRQNEDLPCMAPAWGILFIVEKCFLPREAPFYSSVLTFASLESTISLHTLFTAVSILNLEEKVILKEISKHFPLSLWVGLPTKTKNIWFCYIIRPCPKVDSQTNKQTNNRLLSEIIWDIYRSFPSWFGTQDKFLFVDF